ncbi:hypothetical protein [Defluviimonas salinarum]|uniref:Uncharacterized protein n=1 Tax=Defluviimonas salinarum TaxID=2992147 RepID=A0ABT3J5L5_9RHOB|nr:hypothetical protein [Defluviimonas salinarum]MCW3782989.1 hypothetical protein [Defluviimonas salinarum]
MTRRKFYSTCVDWPKERMLAKAFLDENGEEITRAAFLGLVDPRQMRALETHLGYDIHLKMEADYHVRYFREPVTGIPFFVHSAIEHVFARKDEIDALEAAETDRLCEPKPLAILALIHPGRLIGQDPQDPDFEGDAFDEAIGRIIAHDGGIVILDDESFRGIPAGDRLTLRRALTHAGIGHGVALHVWAAEDGSAAPQDWEGFGDAEPDPGLEFGAMIADLVAQTGERGEIEMIGAVPEPAPEPCHLT